MTDLGSALNLEKPSKPGMIIGHLFLNFRSLAGLYAVYKHSLQLRIKHESLWELTAPLDVGVEVSALLLLMRLLSATGRNILRQFPGPYPSNGYLLQLQISFQPKKSAKEDLKLSTFKEPDEIRRPDLELSIRQVFHDLRRDLRLVIYVGVRHPVTYTHLIRHSNQMSSDFGATTSEYCDNPAGC